KFHRVWQHPCLLPRAKRDEIHSISEIMVDSLGLVKAKSLAAKAILPSPQRGEGLGVRGTLGRQQSCSCLFFQPFPPTPLPSGERGEKHPSPPTPLPQGERGERIAWESRLTFREAFPTVRAHWNTNAGRKEAAGAGWPPGWINTQRRPRAEGRRAMAKAQ